MQNPPPPKQAIGVCSSWEPSASPSTATRKLRLARMPLMNRPPAALSVPPFARWAISEFDSPMDVVTKDAKFNRVWSEAAGRRGCWQAQGGDRSR